MPRHDQPFGGVIGRTVDESTAWWPSLPTPPAGAPNVLVIVLDDVGFSQIGCYGGSTDTPNMDRLAARGLRYTNFHTTALCSPTRACLLTGRNHHAVGVAVIMEVANGFPGYDMQIPRSAGTLAQVLRSQGYNTWCVGKWHLAPDWERTPIGPFDHWPLGMGFERFYGFLGGETDQYGPSLTVDNHRAEPPATAAEGYHLSEDLADRAIQLITDQTSVDPAKPFFCYLAFGACHAPHQAPRAFIDKYRGRFDHGWDVERERVLARQKETGLVPASTELAPRNPGVKPWDELTADERRLFARMQEVYAGFLDHTDHQIGRVLDLLERVGRLDDTLVVLVSDNGASQEGGAVGRFNEMTFFTGVDETVEDILARIDELGGPTANNHYPWGWAQAGNTPLKRYKQNTHGGGIRDPLVVSWPNGITARGEMRTQYLHAVDLMPTVLEATGVERPAVLDGVDQDPLDGIGMRATFDDATAPSRRTVQYYEMLGNRAIYADGWKAVSFHPFDQPVDDDVWELYRVDDDFAEIHDVAAEHPDVLRRLVDLWWAEAGRNDVLPIDHRGAARFLVPKPTATPVRARYVYYPGMGTLPEASTHDVRNRSHRIVADVEIPAGGAEGVVFAQAGRFGGFSLFCQDGHLVYDHNRAGTHHRVTSVGAMPPGRHQLAFEFTATGLGTGDGRLLVDGAVVGEAHLPACVMARYMAEEGFDVGRDTGTPVADTYESPFPFTGSIDRVTVEILGAGERDLGAELGAALSAQ